jgi:type IV pilus assembly protein PilM
MNFKKILKDTLTIKFDKAFGLDIGDRSVEIIELEKAFRYSVITYGRTELEGGIVENGRIVNQAVLAEKIKKLLKEVKPKKVSTNKVVLSLPESQVYVKCFTVDSALKSASLSTAIMDRVSLLLPLNLDKVYWDFLEKSLPDKTKKLIMFVGVPKEVANSYVKFSNSIGLEVVSLSAESLSLARIILKNSPKQSLIMDIGAQSTNLSFFDSNDVINMSVTIPLAGEQMTQAVQNKLKLDFAEAEALKIKLGFKDTKDNKVRPEILPILEDILRETKSAIDYYEETFKQKLDDVYILGGSALLPGINDLIKEKLNRNIQPVSSSFSLDLNSLANKSNYFPLFANVISLGMLGTSSGFTDVNLLKKMPPGEVNMINKLNLFSMGYLTRVNVIRTVLNNKYVLVVLILLIIAIFAVLLQQVEDFGFASVSLNTF